MAIIGKIRERSFLVLVIIGIAILAYSMSAENGVSKALPLLGAVAIGSQRLLPLLQNGYNGLIKLRGSLAAIEDVLKFLEQEAPKE